MSLRFVAAIVSSAAVLFSGTPSPYVWDLPSGFPVPQVPVDNPMTAEKVSLGRYLFYDRRLSFNGTVSCASCHRQELAFADDRVRSAGASGQSTRHNAMSLVNVAYSASLMWDRADVQTLEQQVILPLLARDPVELGMAGRVPELLRTLREVEIYKQCFREAFPGEADPFTLANVAKAIASFERSIISAGAPYDKHRHGGDENAISNSAKRGEVLFFSDSRASCYRCHGGFTFSASFNSMSGPRVIEFKNNGLYKSEAGSDAGLYKFTLRPPDIGKFKPPTVRNIALTAPYMHDGSIATLDGVIDHYASGGNGGPNQDPRIRRLDLTDQNRKDLVAFLESLTDRSLTMDERFADPW